MPGRKALQRIQLGRETTPGTAVACTTLWRGAGAMMEDQRKIDEIDDQVGIIEGPDRTLVTALMAGMELSEIAATPEQFQHLLVMALGGPTAGAADGTGSDKVYVTNVPVGAAPTIKPYTIRAGDDFEAEQMEYSVCTKFSLSGKTGEGVKMSASLIGRQTQPTTFTASLTIPAVSELAVSRGKVFLDAVSGAYGATPVASTILGFKLDVETKYAVKYTMDGNLYYSYLVYAAHKITGELTYEHDTTVSGTGGAKQFFRNQTAMLLSLALLGDPPVTNGTTYQNKQIIANLPIKFTKASVIGDQDGNDIVTMSFRSRYNQTKGDAGQFIVVNELATLP